MIIEAFLDHDVIITKDSKMEEMYDLNEELGKYVIHNPHSYLYIYGHLCELLQ